MRKLFLFTCVLLLSATGFAKSVTIDISDEVGFESVKGYEDDVFVVQRPRLWDFYLSASNYGLEAATTYCKKAGMKYLGHTELTTYGGQQTVSFQKVGDAPKFGHDMTFVATVICQK